MKGILPWPARLLLIAAVAAGFNFWLHTHAPEVLAHSNRYATVFESNQGAYEGIEGNMWVGSPTPVPDGSFSNQTIWATNTSYCGGKSWVEAGWTKKGTAAPRNKLIYKVPGTDNCTYKEDLRESLVAGSWHLHQLRYCGTTCGSDKYWNWYRGGILRRSLKTGWQSANYLVAGGEAYGDTGVGMQGGINNLRYRVGANWFYFSFADSYRCDAGYNLIWNGGDPNDIYDWGPPDQGGCP